MISETQFIGAIISTIALVGGSSISAYIGIIKSHSKLSERIRVLEILFETFGRKAARAIHSPTDHYGIDRLLDKYIDRHYELSMEEWQELHDRVDIIVKDIKTPIELIFAAEMLLVVCMHKLLLPPPKRKQKQI